MPLKYNPNEVLGTMVGIFVWWGLMIACVNVIGPIVRDLDLANILLAKGLILLPSMAVASLGTCKVYRWICA